MQTFLPYADFRRSAECLDRKRCFNQANEALVILRTLLGVYGPGKGWPNHPASRMWRGFESALARYALECCQVSGNVTCAGHVNDLIDEHGLDEQPDLPSWLGGRKFHASHKSNLLRKDREHYKRFGWQVSDAMPYVWPK